jgi:hypothetical protein
VCAADDVLVLARDAELAMPVPASALQRPERGPCITSPQSPPLPQLLVESRHEQCHDLSQLTKNRLVALGQTVVDYAGMKPRCQELFANFSQSQHPQAFQTLP